MSLRDCGHDSDTGIACKCGLVFCPACFRDHMCELSLPELWPHQERVLPEIWARLRAGRHVCVVSPTGSGKTRLAIAVIKLAREDGWSVAWYTHRKLLLGQSAGFIRQHGIAPGIMWSMHEEGFLRDVLVCSLQSVHSKAVRSEQWSLPPVQLVVIDESHVQKGEMAREIFNCHKAGGAVLCGLTATPVNLGDLYDELYVATTKAEQFALGSLVPAEHWAPDEPDLSGIGVDRLEYTEQEQVHAIIRKRIFGRVTAEWARLQRERLGVKDLVMDARPTVLFAPGVPESRWFAAMFQAIGISAAHIDASTPDDEREEILESHRMGHIKVLSNRFILREGWDAPWAEVGIFACVIGKLQTWLQAGGRLLRADPSNPGKRRAIVIDHGGMWWRQGSLNDDHEWRLGDTDGIVKKRLREATPAEKEPCRCPKCGKVLRPYERHMAGGCPYCGHKFKRSVRVVVQLDGTLKRMAGPARRRRKKVADGTRLWDELFWRAVYAKSAHWTFAQVRQQFWARKHAERVEGAVPPYGQWNCPDRDDAARWEKTVKSCYPNLAKRKGKKAPSGKV